jgi:hypothetical protein
MARLSIIRRAFTQSSGMSMAGVDGRQWERRHQKHKRLWKGISIAFGASR